MLFCKMRNGLGRTGEGCGRNPQMWHSSVIVRMCVRGIYIAYFPTWGGPDMGQSPNSQGSYPDHEPACCGPWSRPGNLRNGLRRSCYGGEIDPQWWHFSANV